MGEYGEEFQNVMRPETFRDGRTIPPALGNGTSNDTDAIQFSILRAFLGTGSLSGAQSDVITANASAFGGTVYFPPGTYRIGQPSNPDTGLAALRTRSDLNPWLYVPENVQLRFAPGAVLLPDEYLIGEQGTSGGSAAGSGMGLLPRNSLLGPGGITRPPHRFNPTTYQHPVIDIRGVIDAGMHQIFAIPETHPAASGVILLLSTRISEVHPEWWGASTLDAESQENERGPSTFSWSEVNSAALQYAINAAWRYRHPPTANAKSLRHAIPVVLSGPYVISRTIVVGESFSPSHPSALLGGLLTLRGNRTRGDVRAKRPTLMCSSDFGSFSAAETRGTMMHIRGPYTSILEDIHFDGRTPAGVVMAEECLRLERHRPPGPNPAAASGSTQGTVLRRCSFRAARARLVQLGAEAPLEATEIEHQDLVQRDLWGNQDLLNLAFEQCHFEQIDARSSNREQGADGISFRAANTFNLHFRGCTFQGAVRAMVRCYGGGILLSDSHFSCRPLQLDSLEEVLDNGVDLFVDYPPEKRPPTSSIKAVLGSGGALVGNLPRTGTTPAASEATSRPGLTLPTNITAKNVVSRSLAFLATFRWPVERSSGGTMRRLPPQVAIIGRDTVLDRVHTRNETGVTSSRPTVFWGAVARFGANLVLIGCTFERSSSDSANGGVLVQAVEMVAGRGRVFSVGTSPQGGIVPIYEENAGVIARVDRAPWLRIL